MQRRDFLRTAAASLQVAAQPLAPPSTPKAKITSSVLLSTLKGSFEEKVATAARSGVQSIELGDEYKGWSLADVAQARKLVRSYNLTIDAITVATANGAYAEEFEAPQIILTGIERLPPNPAFTILLDDLQAVKQAANPKVRLLFEVDRQHSIDAIAEAAPYTAVYRITDYPVPPGVYKAIQKAGFAGYLCMAYQPQGDQVVSLTKALNEFRAALI